MECLHFFILKALLNAIDIKYDNIVRITKETLFSFFRVAYSLSTISAAYPLQSSFYIAPLIFRFMHLIPPRDSVG